MLVVDKFKDWDSIVDLESKRMEQIVDYHHVFQIPVFDDSQVFDEKAIFGLHAVFPGKHI